MLPVKRRCWAAQEVDVWVVDVDADNTGIGYAPLIREYVYFLESKLNFHRNHPEFNGAQTSDNWTWEGRHGLADERRLIRIRGVYQLEDDQ